MMSTSSKRIYIILLIVTVVLVISAFDGLFYWLLEDKFEVDSVSTRQAEIDWMVRSFVIYLVYLFLLLFYFLHKVVSNKKRTLTKQEKGLLNELIRLSEIKITADWEQGLLVASVDGITNSLLLFPQGISEMGRTFGVQASECQFQDLDGVTVIAALNLDKQGNLLELNLWKTDFSKVRKIAATFSSVTRSEGLC